MHHKWLLSHYLPTSPPFPTPTPAKHAYKSFPYPSSIRFLPDIFTGPAGLVKVQLVTAEVGNGVFISGAMTKVNGQLALVMDIGDSAPFCLTPRSV